MMHKSMVGRIGPASVKEDVTLKDYIARKQAGDPKKLTFEEWLTSCHRSGKTNANWYIFSQGYSILSIEAIWNAAQENK